MISERLSGGCRVKTKCCGCYHLVHTIHVLVVLSVRFGIGAARLQYGSVAPD